MIVLLLFVCLFLLLISCWILIRNGNVLKFRLNLIDRHFVWMIKNKFEGEGITEFMKRIPSYNKMLFSFKKLKLENWLLIQDLNNLTNK